MFEFQHYNQIHHKDEMIYVLTQEMYHLKLVEFVINLKNDLHNFVLKQGDFHIDVSFL